MLLQSSGFCSKFWVGDNPGISLNDCSLINAIFMPKNHREFDLDWCLSTLLFQMVCWSLQRAFYFGTIAFIGDYFAVWKTFNDVFEMKDDSTKCSTYIPKTHCILVKISLSDYYVVYYKWHNTKAVNNVLYEFIKSLDWFALFSVRKALGRTDELQTYPPVDVKKQQRLTQRNKNLRSISFNVKYIKYTQ